MLKSIFQYIIVFSLLFFGGKYIHLFFLEYTQQTLSYPLEKIYTFHFFFSLAICVLFLVLAKEKKYKNQLGFMYLATLLLKIFIFVIVFKNLIFSAVLLSKTDRISLLIPVGLFLSFEALFISKILKRV